MNKKLGKASDAHINSASLQDTIIHVLTTKLSDEARITRILEIVSVRYLHLPSEMYNKALEPLLCLDPIWLYRLLRDCNEKIDGLSDESGLIYFKNTLYSLFNQVIAAEVCPELLKLSEVTEYTSLVFGKLAGAKRNLIMDEDLIISLQDAFLSCEASIVSSSKKVNPLPTHLNRSIDSSKAYLLSSLARARSNSEFRIQVGMDIIKASYTTVKLAKNFPNLQPTEIAKISSSDHIRSRILGRIYEDVVGRYLRGLRMNEGSLHELSEYVAKLINMQDAESQAVSLRRSIASLTSDLITIESEKNESLQEIANLKKHHSDDLETLKTQLLSSKRVNSVENAELGQKIRSTLIESRRRIDSEIKKLELILQNSPGDTATSKQRLIDRVRSTINDLESKLLEVIS